MTPPTDSASTLCKRKRVVLSLKEKLEIITAIKNGESRAEVAEKYDIGCEIFEIMSRAADPRAPAIISDELSLRCTFLTGLSTITDICKREHDIRVFADPSRKIMKKSANEDLEDAVYMWYQLMHMNGSPVTGHQLCEKALVFNRKMNGDPVFKASNGWLQRFKSRRGVTFDSTQKKLESSEVCLPVSTDHAMLDDEDIIQRCLVSVKSEDTRRAGEDACREQDDTQDAYLDSSTGFIRRKKRRKHISKQTSRSIEEMKRRKLALEIEQLELRNHLCRLEIYQAEKQHSLVPSVHTASLYTEHVRPPITVKKSVKRERVHLPRVPSMLDMGFSQDNSTYIYKEIGAHFAR